MELSKDRKELGKTDGRIVQGIVSHAPGISQDRGGAGMRCVSHMGNEPPGRMPKATAN